MSATAPSFRAPNGTLQKGPPPLAALLLAIGREGDTGDRALSQLGAHTLLEEHVAALRRAGVSEIAVVRPAGAAELPQRLHGVRLVLQPDPAATAFDALVLGLFALDRAPVLVLPGDNDLLGDDTLEMLVEEAADQAATHAVVPRYGDRTGHPVVLFKSAVEALVRDASDPHGVHRLDRLLVRWSPGVRPLDVGDDSVVRYFGAPVRKARSL